MCVTLGIGFINAAACRNTDRPWYLLVGYLTLLPYATPGIDLIL